MYEVRCTTGTTALGSREAAAYVRFTMYDVRLKSSRALRGGGSRRGLPVYDFSEKHER